MPLSQLIIFICAGQQGKGRGGEQAPRPPKPQIPRQEELEELAALQQRPRNALRGIAVWRVPPGTGCQVSHEAVPPSTSLKNRLTPDTAWIAL